MKLGNSIRILGCILLAAGAGLILEGQIGAYVAHGLGEPLETMSPWNLSYYRGVAVVLLPGATLIALGQWLVARRRRRQRRSSYLSDYLLRR